MTPRSPSKTILGVTVGDPAGVGPEVVLKALAAGDRMTECVPLLLGGERALRAASEQTGIAVEIRRVESIAAVDPESRAMQILAVAEEDYPLRPGVVDAACGRFAAAALRAGGELCASGALAGLVTAPVHKTALHLAGVHVEGQTEFLGALWGARRYGMMLIGGGLRILLMTRHMPLRRALDTIDEASALDHLQLLDESLRRIGIIRPRTALAAFNPHAGEGGLFGDEDDRILAPAVRRARELGLDAHGPLPADSLFGRAARGEFDGVVALYHDQGLIPVKTAAFDRAVTVIAGAPHLRVSVIHGAGFDRAGQNRADAVNMREALRVASELAPAWRTHP